MHKDNAAPSGRRADPSGRADPAGRASQAQAQAHKGKMLTTSSSTLIVVESTQIRKHLYSERLPLTSPTHK